MAATSLPSSAQSIDALLTTTSQNIHKAGLVQDNIFNSNAVFHCLHGKEDGIRKEDIGGDLIKVNAMYEGNDTVASFAGDETLADDIQDGMTSSYAAWRQYVGATRMTGLELFQNAGKSKIVDLWTEKVKQTTASFGEVLNAHLLDIVGGDMPTEVTGNTGKNIMSLPYMIQNDPTAVGVFQNIDQVAETWWRNKAIDGSSVGSFKALYQAWFNLYQECGQGGGGSPDIVLTTQKLYADYVMHMDEKIRYEYTDTASAGFENVKFIGAKVFWDVYVPGQVVAAQTNGGPGVTLDDGHTYMLNSDFLSLKVGKGLDFKPQGVHTPEAKDGKREYSLFYGQLVTNNRRKHGVLFNVDHLNAS